MVAIAASRPRLLCQVRVPNNQGTGYMSLALQKYKNTEHGPHGEMVIEGVDLPTAYLRGKCENFYEEHEVLPAAPSRPLLSALPAAPWQEDIESLVRTTAVEDVAEKLCRGTTRMCPEARSRCPAPPLR